MGSSGDATLTLTLVPHDQTPEDCIGYSDGGPVAPGGCTTLWAHVEFAPLSLSRDLPCWINGVEGVPWDSSFESKTLYLQAPLDLPGDTVCSSNGCTNEVHFTLNTRTGEVSDFYADSEGNGLGGDSSGYLLEGSGHFECHDQ